MTYRDNIKAILEANFIGFNEEYLDRVCSKICGIQSTEKSYEDGLNEAWECAGKIVQSSRGYSHDEINEIYGARIRAFDLTPSEAIAKIKEYEFKQKKIKPNCSYLNDICPYDIKCADCEVHCSLKRAKNKIKELR